ncbi:hypothetical protein Tco_0949302 [Tanacetum coccineum]
MMSKKMAELEDDFHEFKANTERRFVSLDMSIRAYRLEEDQRHEEQIRRYDELKNLLLSLIHKSSSPVQSSRPITTKVPTKPTECAPSYGDFGCLSPNNVTDFEEDKIINPRSFITNNSAPPLMSRTPLISFSEPGLIRLTNAMQRKRKEAKTTSTKQQEKDKKGKHVERRVTYGGWWIH